MHLNVLTYLMVYLAAMVLVVPLCKRLGLGVVPGYLLAGLLIGPSGFALTQNTADIELLAELGVVLMLFTIGLELDTKKLWAMRRLVFVFGAVQMLICAAGVAAAFVLMNTSWALAVILGVTLALSSTAVAIQLMKDRNLLRSSTGQRVFAVLLFQDMAAIPLLIGVGLLAPANDSNAGFAWLPALGAIALLLLLGRFLIGYLLHWVAHYGSRELFVGLALLLVIAVMELMGAAGLSAGLGAFIAGVMLASSEFRHQLEADLEPFKGLFLGLFFITIGSGIELHFFISNWPLILQLLALFVGIKIVLLYVIAALQGMAGPERLSYAILLGQGSEFAFVVGALATSGALLTAAEGATLNLVITLSVALSPMLMVLNDKLQRLFQHSAKQADDTVVMEENSVIIAGFGRYGQIVGRLLLANGVTPTIIDHDSGTIQNMRRFGFNVYYGDVCRPELLHAAGAEKASVLLIAIDERESINQVARMAHEHFAHLRVMARAVDSSHVHELKRLGVQHIQRELFESSLQQGRDVLVALGWGRYEAREMADRFRAANLSLLQKMEQWREQNDAKSFFLQLKQSRDELREQLEQETKQASEIRKQRTD